MLAVLYANLEDACGQVLLSALKDLGGQPVYSGRQSLLHEQSAKLGKPKKYPAYVLFVAYRLNKHDTSSPRSFTSDNVEVRQK